MTRIIAGRFEQQSQAQDAIAEILRAGFNEDQISTFYVNPAGQHDTYKIGGDRDKSPGTEDNAAGRAAGMATGGAVGAAVGAVTTPFTGPLGAITGGMVGAHLGSFAGSLGSMKDDGEEVEEHEVPIRQAGMLVAISVPEDDKENIAIDALRAVGAADIERNEGTIIDGDWKDFDPVAPPSLIEDSSH